MTYAQGYRDGIEAAAHEIGFADLSRFGVIETDWLSDRVRALPVPEEPPPEPSEEKIERAKHIAFINNLWGAPGEDYNTEKGREILVDLVMSLGLESLTDDAVRQLAERHRSLDEKLR